MQGLKLRQILRQFRQERIGEDFRHLFVSGAAAVANQLADIDFECACQSLQRTEGRDRFAVLNFGDVGAGNLHAAGQLALTQVTSLPDVLDLRGYPETRVEIACGLWLTAMISIGAGASSTSSGLWHRLHMELLVLN